LEEEVVATILKDVVRVTIHTAKIHTVDIMAYK